VALLSWKRRAKPMDCVLCGGRTEVRLIDTHMTVRGRRIELKDVPADVCRQCGEPYFEMAIYEQMERDARERASR
jgi:YgiT-type zinc finger domain-containing protein